MCTALRGRLPAGHGSRLCAPGDPVEAEYGPAIRLGTRVDELLIETFGGFGPALEELLVEAAATRADCRQAHQVGV